jgi:hypothetical protein
MMTKRWRQNSSMEAALELREERRRAEKDAAKTGRASPFYRGSEGGEHQGFVAGVNALAWRRRLPESRGGGGVIAVN